MKRLVKPFNKLAPLLIVIFMVSPVWAIDMTTVDEVIQLNQSPSSNAPKVELSKPVERMATPLHTELGINNPLSAEDKQNLEILWGAVIERNPIVQFGLNRLATPVELRDKHNPWMARTLSGLISGVAMLPYAMGADQWTSGAAFIGRNMAQRAVLKTDAMEEKDLPSDRELVELSALVQELQQQMITEYFSYKRSLLQTGHVQDQMAWIQRRLHKQSLSPTERLWLQQRLQTLGWNRLQEQSEAQNHLILLERLAGVDAVKQLAFDHTELTVEPPTKPSQKGL